jgi:alkylation response protein AidB-like acyl-CoA dehydrogenase
MNYDLTPVQQVIAKAALDFADEFLEPIATDLDRSGLFPKALVTQMAAQKFLGVVLPKDFGGTAAGFVAHIEVVRALSHSCAAVASILNNHAVAAYAVSRWGSAAQKAGYVTALAKGEKLGALAIYESGPAFGLGEGALLATLSNGVYTLNGTKTFVRNAGVADTYIVFASIQLQLDKTTPVAFIVDANTVGLQLGAAFETMGLHGCPVANISFKDVTLKQDACLGDEQTASAILAELLSILSVGEAAQTVGIAQAAVKHAAGAAKRRIQFGNPIFSLEAIQVMLADIATDTHVAWLALQKTAQLIDDNAPFQTDAAMVKNFLARAGVKILVDAVQVEGGTGICETVPKHMRGPMPLARMFRDIAGTTLSDAPADFPAQLIASAI